MNSVYFRSGMAVAVDWNAEFGSKNPESADMIGMFMGNENPIEAFRGSVEGQEAFANAFGANTTIY